MEHVAHQSQRGLIDRHFAERATPDGEVVMRNHLAGCAECRAYYDRRALLSTLDPAAAPAIERLAAGLGFRSGAATKRAWFAGLVLAPAAALLVFVLVSQGARYGGSADGPEWAARGGAVMGPSVAPGMAPPALWAYRVAGGKATPLAGRMNAADELAFAYQNPTGFSHLSVVAVDQQGRAFWYHPDPAEGRALAIVRSAPRQELPVAIRHALSPGPMRLIGIFSHQALSVGQLAPLLGGGCATVRASLPGVVCVEHAVEVQP
jgi:hypothetical protein